MFQEESSMFNFVKVKDGRLYWRQIVRRADGSVFMRLGVRTRKVFRVNQDARGVFE